jgi:16S rRNA (guanine966-N2)-methyltransferase
MSPRRNRNSKPAPHHLENDSFVRIIGGDWRSRKLSFPESEGLRPTPDRVRETLFNWLQAYTPAAKCLDLFSGSGALAFEALSRGAAHATLIDASRLVCSSLKQNLHELKAQNAEVLETDATQWLLQQAKSEFRYDLVFLDPPFNKNLVSGICQLLEENQVLADGSMIYIETERSLNTLSVPDNWQLYRDKQAGDVNYRLYKRN